MNWPGEALLLKLWETLTERGIGQLLKPWQIRREGVAQVDVHRYQILALAQAEREADEIRSGTRRIANAEYEISSTESEAKAEPCLVREGYIRPVLQLATESIIADTIRREVNVAKALMHAEAELKNDQTHPPDAKIDPDWLFRWRDYASSVSSDELQGLWGKLLAGELKSPGEFSLRVLEFIKTLTTKEAKLIEKAFPFIVSAAIVSNQESTLKRSGITFEHLLELQEIGILSGVGTFGLTKTFSSAQSDSFICVLCSHNKGILVEHSDPAKTFQLQVSVVSALGLQVIKLGTFVPNIDYLHAVGRHIKSLGFSVSMVNVKMTGSMAHYSHKQELPDP